MPALSPAVAPPVKPWPLLAICGALLAATLAAYWQVTGFELVEVDDPVYVSNNVAVRAGLTWPSAAWAFNIGYASNWHPLTWLSHMLDCQLYGLEPGQLHGSGGHHLTNLLLHLANTLLVLLVLNRLTGWVWRSAFVAALFALHPLHAESVAWVAERKDVLSTFFLLLTLLAWQQYARETAGALQAGPRARSHRGIAPRSRKRLVFYFLSLSFFACGLMSKQMLVTVPLLLWLLDYWPLKRSRWAGGKETAGQLIAETIPYFALALIAGVLVILAQSHGGAIAAAEQTPLLSRIMNATVTYVVYLLQMVWPAHLAHYYPWEGDQWTPWQVLGGAAFLGLITGLALRSARRYPCVPVGWFWYLITLVPVIGLVQIGAQARADRYTYIPLLGIFIVIAFLTPELLRKWRPSAPVLGATATLVIALLIPLAHVQAGYWRNSATLYAHTLAVTENNWIVHNAMASLLNNEADRLRGLGQLAEATAKNEEAIRHLRTTLALMPGMVDAHNCLANALLSTGRIDEAIAEYEIALQLGPTDALTHNNLGTAWLQKQQFDKAIEHYRQSLKSDPNACNTHFNLGLCLAAQGHADEALAEFQTVLKLFPNDVVAYRAYREMALVLQSKGKRAEAIEALKKAVAINARSQVDAAQNTALHDLERIQRTAATP